MQLLVADQHTEGSCEKAVEAAGAGKGGAS